MKQKLMKSLFQRISFLMLLLFCATLTYAQNNTVSGRVVDSQGEPVIGASVVVKGQSKGVVTDADGNFTIDAAKGETLQFSYIGYRAVHKQVNKNTTIFV